MFAKYFGWAVVLAIGLQVGGCYTDYGPISAEPEPVRESLSVVTYLQTGDQLKVTVYGEDALTNTYTISPTGEIVMPLIGAVHSAGRTRSELEREIARRYSSGKFLQEPKVTVDVLNFRPIYVLGETLRPGAYPYTSGLNVLTAIAVAGGPTYRASKDRVFIQHPGETVWQEYPLTAAVQIGPGDLIRLPERYF